MLTLTLTTTTDLAPMLEAFSRRARLVAGEAPPDAAELDDVKAHVAKTLDEARVAEQRALKTRLEQGLPRGARLTQLSSRREGLTLTSATTVELDDVALVPTLEFAGAEGQPALRPFSGFTVSKEAGAVVLKGRAPEVPAGAGSLSLSLKSTVPAKTHNASAEHEGELTWSGSGFEVRVAFG
ncbi:MAG: hypothetical protein SFW67_10905 [Myxococcaceae bacterium]|nr:hypothetical protein [Myxococcaceae bacterium]